MVGKPSDMDDFHMAWEWTGPAATAVVGLAGMAVAWRAGRQQQARQQVRDLRDERKTLYLDYLAASDEARMQILRLETLREINNGGRTENAAEVRATYELTKRLFNLSGKLELMVPPSVMGHIDDEAKVHMSLLFVLTHAEETGSYEDNYQSISRQLDDARRRVTEAIKTDLRKPVTSH
jgi:hypothetical protein